MSRNILIGLVGIALGFTVSQTGFSDFGQMHSMLTLSNWPLLMAFLSSVFLTVLGFLLWRRKIRLNKITLHKGTVIGGIIFGIGLALTGSSPSICLVQIGEGKIVALLTLLGIVTGMTLAKDFQNRYYAWQNIQSCDD